jgi:acyl transferase domain-containing protein
MEKIKKYILEQVATHRLLKSDAAVMLKELYYNKGNAEEEIAVIGMDCRFPQANNVDEYWRNVRNGMVCTSAFPETRRKDTDPLIKNEHNGSEDPYLVQGYVEEIDKFDPVFFNITPDETNKMDPAQRLFLETVWGALEDAGLGGERLTGTNTGVFVGKAHLCEPLYKDFITDLDMLGWTGSVSGLLASRIAYYLNLTGPAMVLDSACSSGLVAVHLACRSLKNGECDVAIAGGVSLLLMPLKENRISMLESPDSILRPFDRMSNGTVWGEGVGAVILKPLKKAVEDRDNIHGVIKGSAINHNGASNGITAPSLESQEKLLAGLWEKLRINPETFSYFEAHGTGTPLGDPIEIKAITNAFKKFTQKKSFCPLGTVKSNIGHLIAASGIAALIKSILILKYREIPPTVHYTEPNPYINFDDAPVFVNKRPMQPENDALPIRIGINSFGVSGTNGHLVLEETPKFVQDKSKRNKFNLFTLAVKKELLLKDYVARFLDFLKNNSDFELEDICFSGNTGKGHYRHRLAMIVEDANDLTEKLNILGQLNEIKSIPEERVYYGEHSIVLKQSKAGVDGRITKEEKKRIDEEASFKVNEFIESDKSNNGLLDEIARCYVKGADVRWNMLYDKNNVRKVSIPHYPFERRRCWVSGREGKPDYEFQGL